MLKDYSVFSKNSLSLSYKVMFQYKYKQYLFLLYQTFVPRKNWVLGLDIIPKTQKFLYPNPKPKNIYTQTQNPNPKIFWVQTSVLY